MVGPLCPALFTAGLPRDPHVPPRPGPGPAHSTKQGLVVVQGLRRLWGTGAYAGSSGVQEPEGLPEEAGLEWGTSDGAGDDLSQGAKLWLRARQGWSAGLEKGFPGVGVGRVPLLGAAGYPPVAWGGAGPWAPLVAPPCPAEDGCPEEVRAGSVPALPLPPLGLDRRGQGGGGGPLLWPDWALAEDVVWPGGSAEEPREGRYRLRKRPLDRVLVEPLRGHGVRGEGRPASEPQEDRASAGKQSPPLRSFTLLVPWTLLRATPLPSGLITV